jgi:hypothetical protein
MGVAEVARFEGVGWGLMGFLRLWKAVEKRSRGIHNAPIPQRWRFVNHRGILYTNHLG